jgi:hypothetical protein
MENVLHQIFSIDLLQDQSMKLSIDFLQLYHQRIISLVLKVQPLLIFSLKENLASLEHFLLILFQVQEDIKLKVLVMREELMMIALNFCIFLVV